AQPRLGVEGGLVIRAVVAALPGVVDRVARRVPGELVGVAAARLATGGGNVLGQALRAVVALDGLVAGGQVPGGAGGEIARHGWQRRGLPARQLHEEGERSEE